MQGNTAIRARLPQQAGFPSTEIHQFNKGSFMGMYYPINNGNCVWSMGVPEHIMDEAAAKLQIQDVQRQEAEEKGHTNTGDTTGYALLVRTHTGQHVHGHKCILWAYCASFTVHHL